MTNAPPTRAALIRAMARQICCDFDCPAGKGCPDEPFYCEKVADGVLAAIEAAGCRVVPAEATLKMAKNGAQACFNPEFNNWHAASRDAEECWATMLNASPYAPEAEE